MKQRNYERKNLAKIGFIFLIGAEIIGILFLWKMKEYEYVWKQDNLIVIDMNSECLGRRRIVSVKRSIKKKYFCDYTESGKWILYEVGEKNSWTSKKKWTGNKIGVNGVRYITELLETNTILSELLLDGDDFYVL